MNKLITTVISAALVMAAPVFADDAHHPEKAQETKAAPATKAPEQSVKKMQDNVKKMQGQLERVAKAKTDAERQQALAEHMRTMQENMMMARGMQAGTMGCPMMEGGMMGGKGGMGMMGGMGGMGGGMMGGAQPGGAPERMLQMERRMDMMQMMMDRLPATPTK